MDKRNSFIAFDQYQRYQTVAKLISFHRNGQVNRRFTVLELGSNEHKDLRFFLENDEILFTDVVLTEKMKNDSDFQIADGTNLQFDDNSFDFVVACDVFEHIPEEKRAAFISEAYRVAKCGVIFCFPYDSPNVEAAECRVNTYYKILSGEDFVWLKEHSENGLPKISKVEDTLDLLGINHFSLYHGNLELWEKLWYCHFDTVFQPQTLAFREQIDHYYNTQLYGKDVKGDCYRVFYVLTKSDAQAWRGYAHAMWDEGAVDLSFLNLLIQKHGSLGPVSDGINHTALEMERQLHDFSQIMEEKDRHIQKQNEMMEQTMENYRSLEDSYRRDIASFNQQIAQIRENNAQEQLRTSREMRELARESAETVRRYEEQLELYKKLSGDYAALQTEKRQLLEAKTEVEQELAVYKEQYLMAIAQRDDLTNQLAYLQYSHNSVLDSLSWRVTAPLRRLSAGVKKVLKKNKYAFLVAKGVKSLLKYGVRPTWAKVKWKLKNRFAGETVTCDIASQAMTEQERDEVPEYIKFSVLVPLYNTREDYLREMIQSVKDQSYGNWELCLADGSDEAHGYVEQVCLEYAASDPRIRYQRLAENRGISENTNACAEMATGDYIALLDHDDLYARDALRWNAKAIYETDADVLYSDEDHLALNGTHVNPFYKPDWSPDLLYSQMYICHLLVFRRSLFEAIGGYRKEYDGSQDYDLMLRFSERTERICHIPRVLYSWRESETSTAANANAKPYAHIAGRNALDAHLKRKYGPNAYAGETEHLFVYQPRFGLEEKPRISIIIPMKDHWEMTDACIRSIFEKSTYPNYEIIVLDNRSEKPDTFAWFEKISEDSRVRVIKADMEFNWSKLNNFGVSQATGDVFVFLNNDTLIISEDWLERLAENTLRPDVGVVGGLLLYEDNTIQHAGVVVGFSGWADHVFKGMEPIHYGAPFVSPMVSRNVLAVTGACMAVSRKTLEKIGPFDETFIICGSDVELCIRAHDHGLFNRYDVNVRLYHLESKSRDSYIPEIDFQKSYEAYGPYRENVDPYFNINLDINSVVPRERVASMNLVNFKNFLKHCPLTANAYQKMKAALQEPVDCSVAEIGSLVPRKADSICEGKRLNLLVPSVDKAHVFGGISTALKFYETLAQCGNFALRIVTLDAGVDPKTSVLSGDYVLVAPEDNSGAMKQVLPMADRYNRTFPVCENDVFMATSWWSAYVANDVLNWQKETYGHIDPLVYFIQDYEPGFYPWSSRYMLADSTYRMDIPVYAVVNSKLLNDHLVQKGYQFERSWYFEPTLNDSLKQYLPEMGTIVPKKKQILVYGRPNTARNAFELLVYGLKEWAAKQEHVDQWTVLSAGEQHGDVDLGNGVVLHSVGKLSLEDYAKMMLDTYAGVSLMVSPHPSYPPLEMATFGAKTITNCYESKDLSDFSDNMVSLKSCAPRDIAKKLLEICSHYDGQGVISAKPDYVRETSVFGSIPEQVCAELISEEKPADTLS